MTQNSLIFYFIFLLFLLISFGSVKSLFKFFFYTEVLWLILFLFCLILETSTNSNLLTINSLLILVFTAIEALLIGCIFLYNSKHNFSRI